MNKFYKTILACLCVLGTMFIYSFSTDDDLINKIQQQLQKWTEEQPIEKVHLHLDKPYYTAGEDIWFKAYVTIGTQHQLSAYSGVLNVELIDEQDSIKQSVKLQLKGGTAAGDFALPDTIHEGNYRIRAYTQYMLNYRGNYLFDKTITISNVATNKIFTNTAFSFSKGENNPVINTTINYTDKNGVAYVNDKITYTVLLGNKQVAKGKATTDTEGNAKFTVPVTDAGLLKYGRIVTGLILNRQETIYKSIPLRVQSGKTDVQFFPEGGNMLIGHPTRMAFKAIGSDGLGVDIKGVVTDNTGREVAIIKSQHLGMGVFDFLPEANKTYKAELTYPDGSKGPVVLPAAIDNGYALNIYTGDAQSIRLTVSSANATKENFNGTLSLVGTSAGKVYYAARTKPGATTFTAAVPRSRFPSGIVQFTLFSDKGEPLNERLVFMQNNDQLSLTVNADKSIYTPREKVKLNVNSKNKEGKGTTGSFSVAVTDETKIPVDENNENNILANLLLTSDLKGYIEQPAYYFNKVSEETQADLDVLMLTQGYRRYEWKKVLNGDPTALNYIKQTTFTISGRVTTLTGKPVPKGKVELLNFDDGMFKLDTLTDENGRFTFEDLLFPDSTKFLIQARTAKRKRNVNITLDTIPPPSTGNYAGLPDYKINVSTATSAYAQNNKLLYSELIKSGLGNHVIGLKEVQILAKKDAFKHSQNLNGPGNADQTFTAKQMQNFNCVKFFDCFQGRMTGVIIRNGRPFSTRNNLAPMAIIVDGMFTDPIDAEFLNVSDVQSVEVLLSTASTVMYGARAAAGAILITTKRGDEIDNKQDRYGSGVSTYHPKGLYKARAFYSPTYDAKTNKQIADLRTTIYWNPNIITADDGKFTLDYFNAGSKGTYRVVIEGVNGDGNIGRTVYRYRVE